MLGQLECEFALFVWVINIRLLRSIPERESQIRLEFVLIAGYFVFHEQWQEKIYRLWHVCV